MLCLAVSVSVLSGFDPTPFLTALLVAWSVAMRRSLRVVTALVAIYLLVLVVLHLAMYQYHLQATPIEWLAFSAVGLTALFAGAVPGLATSLGPIRVTRATQGCGPGR